MVSAKKVQEEANNPKPSIFWFEKSRLRALNLILGVARFWLRKEVAAVTWTVSGKTLTVTNVDLELLTCGESLETGTLKRSVLCCQP